MTELLAADRVYIHFPWCEKKCPYCDFNSHTGGFDGSDYAEAVLAEIQHHTTKIRGPLQSIYFGGGTPSMWAPDDLARVLDHLTERYGLAPNAEITLEANPGTVVPDRFRAFGARGINRFSIGVQSFIEEELKLLGRIHDAAQAEDAVKGALQSGARVSFDLIYGLPNQDEDQVLHSLDRALALKPQHLSAYALTIEPETAFGRRTKLGLFKPMADDNQAHLMGRVGEHLKQHGLPRYEISSYAAPDNEARHNQAYWHGESYAGVGAGAHSYWASADLKTSRRRASTKHPARYMAAARQNAPTFEYSEDLSLTDTLKDRLLTATRTRSGFVPAKLDAQAQLQGQLSELATKALAPFVECGWLTHHAGRYTPTDIGYLFGDSMARRLLEIPDGLDIKSDGPR